MAKNEVNDFSKIEESAKISILQFVPLKILPSISSHLHVAHKLLPHNDVKNQKLKNLSDVPFRKENWQHGLLAT